MQIVEILAGFVGLREMWIEENDYFDISSILNKQKLSFMNSR